MPPKKKKMKLKSIFTFDPSHPSTGFLSCSEFALHTHTGRLGWKAAGLQEEACTPPCLTSNVLIFTCSADSFSESKIQVTFSFNGIENIRITKQLTKLQLNKVNVFIKVQFNYCILEWLLFIFFHWALWVGVFLVWKTETFLMTCCKFVNKEGNTLSHHSFPNWVLVFYKELS